MLNNWTIKRRTKINTTELSVTNKNTSFWIPFSLMLPSIIFLILFTVIPLVIAIQDSAATPTNGIHSSYYELLWSDQQWIYSIKNSFLYALISLPLTLIISLMIATAVSNVGRKKLRGFWQTIFFLPYVTSTVAISLTFAYLLNAQYGLINEIFGIDVGWLITPAEDGNAGLGSMVLFGTWSGLAFNTLILTTAMLSVDKTLYDAAAIDGTSQWKQFTKITLPAIERTIWYLITVGLIGAIKVFPLALFGNNTEVALKNGPTMLIYIYNKVENSQYGLAGAASVMLLVLSITFNIAVIWTIKFTQKTINAVSRFVEQSKIERHQNKLYYHSDDEDEEPRSIDGKSLELPVDNRTGILIHGPPEASGIDGEGI